MINELRNGSNGIRQKAAEALGKIGDDTAVSPLMDALKDSSWEVRYTAADALGLIKDKKAENVLIRALKDKSHAVRNAAVDALVLLNSKKAVTPLIKGLGDDENYVVTLIIAALGQLGELKAVPHLLKQLIRWEFKTDAYKALQQLNFTPTNMTEKVHLWIGSGEKDKLIDNFNQTKKVLFSDIQSGRRSTIQYALYSFIRLGKGEIIPDLIDTLNRKGSVDMAEAYLNCGHNKLYDAAKKWAKNNGYDISSSGGTAQVRWGS